MNLGEIIIDTIKSDSLKKIRELYYSEDIEDKEIAKNWLAQLIGQKDSDANLLVLDIYKDMEDDTDIIIDHETYCKMKFKTFSISFGKNYMYSVTFDIKFKGLVISDTNRYYSRYRVGDGDPKYDALDSVCKWFRKNGFNLHNDLFK